MSFVLRSRCACLTFGLIAVAFADFAPLAHAGKLRFGDETIVRHLADVRLQNGEGEPLYLGYRLTFHWFGLPYGVSADGYTLGVRGKSVEYDIEKSKLIEWQGEGYVPSPLPQYRLTVADHLFGHLAWIIAALVGLWYGGRALLFRRDASRPRVVLAATPAKAASEPTLRTAAPAAEVSAADTTAAPKPAPAAGGVRPMVKPQIAMIQPRQSGSATPRPVSPPQRPTVAKTRCRVKSLKVA